FWDDLPVSRLEVVWTSWKSSDKVVLTSRKSSGLPGSRLNFSERFGKFLCLIFLHLVFQIWKTSGTTYLLVVRKSYGSRLEVALDFLKVVWTSVKSSGSRPNFLKFSRKVVSTSEVAWTS
ncbi:unnamed protein product, partial [Brassica rapa]